MKAVILAAGVGSRLRPHTNDKPKSMVEIKGISILKRMIDTIQSVGIKELVVLTGYHHQKIEEFITKNYPDLDVTFVHNDKYDQTNTGYSLWMTKDSVSESDFVKFDADVVFEQEVLKRLLEHPATSALCIDTNINLAAEEVKVIADEDGKVIAVGKGLDPHKSTGESIGIEKISKEAAKVLFSELEKLMADPANHQRYYDDSYTTLVEQGIPFHHVDITGLKWVEIDNHDDLALATELFSEEE